MTDNRPPVGSRVVRLGQTLVVTGHPDVTPDYPTRILVSDPLNEFGTEFDAYNYHQVTGLTALWARLLHRFVNLANHMARRASRCLHRIEHGPGWPRSTRKGTP